MIETIEAMMPSTSIEISLALLIISICAFMDILSPGVLAVTGYLLLTQPNHLSSHLFIFLLITQSGYFLIGLFLYFGGESILKGIDQFSQFDVINWFYILLGIILVLISFSKPKARTKKFLRSWIPTNASTRGMILLGIIVFLIEFVTALPYFYSIFLMNHINIAPFPSIVILIGYNLVMVLPSLLLLGIYILFQARLQQFLSNVRSKLKEAPISSLLTAIGLIGAVFFNIGLQGILH